MAEEYKLQKGSLGLWYVVFFVVAAASPLTGVVGALIMKAGQLILTGSIICPMDLKAGQYQFQVLGQQVSLKVT